MKDAVNKHIKIILLSIFLLIISNILSTIHPYILKQVLDIDFSASNIQQIILRYIIIYFTIHIVLVIVKFIRNVAINKAICKVIQDIREKVFNKVLKFKMITFNKYNSSILYTRLTDDVDNLFDLFFGVSYQIASNLLKIIFMVIMMFFAQVNLALIGFITILIVATISLKSAKILGSINDKILGKRDLENKEYSELYNKNKITYLFKLQKQNIEKMNKLFDEELQFRKKYIFVHHFPYWIVTVVQAIGIYAILHYALNLSISVGNIYLVVLYTKDCRSPLQEMFDKLEELQTCINSYNRIKKILKEKNEEDIDKGEYIENLNGDIEFRNVSMRYDKEMVLKDMSFVIKKGTKVTIAGRTGVGKSTMTKVFMRLYDISSGQIYIGEHDINKISIRSVRDSISYISQTPYIFEDTVRNNIILGNENITDSQIMNLVQEMGVNSIFEKLDKGLDTQIDISKMSYGELQVIAFIRAILHKANIYIFDEPTSNIDLKTENMIQNIIDKISEKSTVIIIAHRQSTIASSDKIIYLKDGQIDMIVNRVPV